MILKVSCNCKLINTSFAVLQESKHAADFQLGVQKKKNSQTGDSQREKQQGWQLSKQKEFKEWEELKMKEKMKKETKDTQSCKSQEQAVLKN